MPNAPRPHKKFAKIAYKILKTPKEQQQFRNDKPTQKQLDSWFIDSTVSQ